MTIEEWERILAAVESGDHERIWDTIAESRVTAAISAQRHPTADPHALVEALSLAAHAPRATCRRCEHPDVAHVPQCALCYCAFLDVVPRAV